MLPPVIPETPPAPIAPPPVIESGPVAYEEPAEEEEDEEVEEPCVSAMKLMGGNGQYEQRTGDEVTFSDQNGCQFNSQIESNTVYIYISK